MPLYQGIPPEHLQAVLEVTRLHGAHYPMSVSTPGAEGEAMILAKYIAETLAPATAIDVGCAGGHLVLALLRHGVMTIGLDAHIDAAPCLGAPILLRDASQKLDVLPKAALAICLDMPEHVPANRADDLVANLCAMAPKVYFSAGVPGYEGAVGHVNCQEVNYWAAKFLPFGYYPAPGFAEWKDELRRRIETAQKESYCWWSWSGQAQLYVKA